MKKSLLGSLFLLLLYSQTFAQNSPSSETDDGVFSYADLSVPYNLMEAYGMDFACGFVAMVKLPELRSDHLLKEIVFNCDAKNDKRAAILLMDSSRKVVYTEPVIAVEGTNRITLQTPQKLTPGTYYVGCYIHSKGKDLSPVLLDGSETPIKGVNYMKVIEMQPTTIGIGDVIELEDFASAGYGNLLIAVGIEGSDVKDLAVAEDVLGITTLPPGANASLELRVRNVGINPIEQIRVTFSHQGEEQGVDVTCHIDGGSSSLVPISYKFPEEDSDNHIKVRITEVNGSENRLAEHEIEFPFEILEEGGPFARKNILLEEFTTEECGNCPAGAEVLAKIVARLEEEGFEVDFIAHHAGFGTDRYTLKESEELLDDLYKGGLFAPAVCLNRLPIGENGGAAISVQPFLAEQFVERLQKELQWGTIEDILFEKETLTVKGLMVKGVDETSPRLHLVITEDNIPTTTQNGAVGSYTHRHVARKFLTPTVGLPFTFDASGSFSLKIPLPQLNPEWKKEDLQVVAFVTSSPEGEKNEDSEVSIGGVVLFSKSVPFTDNTYTSRMHSEPITVLVRDGFLHVDGEYRDLSLYDSFGHRCSPRERLRPGVYIVRITTEDESFSRKIVVKKDS